jgi:hypothetical protein
MAPDLISIDSEDEETLIVHGAADVPSRLRPRISSTHIGGTHATAQYAFLCENSNPIDILYVSRLCVLEAVRNPPTFSPDGMSSSPRQRQPLHFEASDETIHALLVDAYIHTDFQTPSTEPSIPLSRDSPDIKLVVEDV